MTAPITIGAPILEHLPTKSVGGDTESFAFRRGMMAPTTVCVQAGTTDGQHHVYVTRDTEDALAWMLTDFDQIWWHNGIAFDAACILEWYPRLAMLLWAAFERGAMLDTMYLQRMIQVARGTGGPLGLDRVAAAYGVRPPTKVIEAEWEGQVYDVRTSFGLWYGASEIPEPWYSYADYDGEVMLPLANAMMGAAVTRPNPLVRLDDLATICRTYCGLHLSAVYGMHINPDAVGDLANAAHAAMKRLKSAALHNGFLKPKAATRKEIAAGLVVPGAFCKVRNLHPPKTWKTDRARGTWERRIAKHEGCVGCARQAVDADTGEGLWTKDTKLLQVRVTEAYEGNPPITQPKKDKKTGKRTGGGQIATSRDALQDSGNPELEAWSEYNEFAAVINKDLEIFKNSPVHAGIGLTNNMRPSSFSPNLLNFRRKGFLIASCPTCDFERTVDPKEAKTRLLCPICEPNVKIV